MMHLKNIKAGNPKTPEQYQLTKKAGVVWLFCEDGKNWYEEQKNFQPDTIKLLTMRTTSSLLSVKTFQLLILKG